MTRAVCERCLRAQSACICRWIKPLQAQAHLLILQHPLEVGNAKNSARLLHLCVTGSVMATGEAFDAGVLDSLLHADGRTPVLLYPATPDDAGLPIPPPMPALPAEAMRLVLLDGTWRKSRKMLYLNPALQRLPRLALTDVAPSNYRIRKAHAPHQLSSLEAAAQALGQLENAPGCFNPLLDAFDGFVAQQAAYVRARAAGSPACNASKSDEQDVNRLVGRKTETPVKMNRILTCFLYDRIMQEQSSTSPTVYYDGGCPVCTREIALYQRQDGADQVCWVDVAHCAPEALGPGLNREAAMARLHMRRPDGTLASGAEAFTLLWRSLPRWAWLGRLLGSRLALALLEPAYRLFLVMRPLWRGRGSKR